MALPFVNRAVRWVTRGSIRLLTGLAALALAFTAGVAPVTGPVSDAAAGGAQQVVAERAPQVRVAQREAALSEAAEAREERTAAEAREERAATGADADAERPVSTVEAEPGDQAAGQTSDSAAQADDTAGQASDSAGLALSVGLPIDALPTRSGPVAAPRHGARSTGTAPPLGQRAPPTA